MKELNTLHIEWELYKNQYSETDWNLLKSRLHQLIKKIETEYWFHLQKGLLEGLGMEELSGYDGDPANIISSISNNLTLSQAMPRIYESVTNLLEQQIIHGGPTIFLDVNEFRKTAASRLIPLIVREREKETESTRIPIRGNKVLLRSLWFTAYGFDILRALDLSLETDIHGLAQVEANLRKVGLTIRKEEVDDSFEFIRPDISRSMENFILEIVRLMRQEPDLVKRKPWSET
jgi:hypothetical protein